MCALITLIPHCAQVPRVEHHVTLRWIVTRPAHFPLPLVVYASHPVLLPPQPRHTPARIKFCQRRCSAGSRRRKDGRHPEVDRGWSIGPRSVEAPRNGPRRPRLVQSGKKKVHRERSESMRRFDKPTPCEQYPTRSGDNSSAGGVFNVCVPLFMKCGRRALLQAGLYSQHIKLMSALRAD